MLYHRVEENSLFYGAAEVNDAINEALKTANLFGGFNTDRIPITPLSIANRVIYPFPSQVLFPTDVYFEGRALLDASASSIGQSYPSWLASGAYPGPPTYWIPIGITAFGLLPCDTAGGGFLEVAGVMEPADLVNPTDTTNLPDEWVDLVADYAYLTITLDEGGKIFSDSSRQYPQIQKKITELSRWQKFKWPNVRNQMKSVR